MDNREKRPGCFFTTSIVSVFIIVAAVTGLTIWIIQLARAGDPVGIGILLYLGLLSLILCGAVATALIIGGLRKKRTHDEYNAVMRAFNDQSRSVVQLTKVTSDLALASSDSWPLMRAYPPALPPGQLRGPGNMVIDQDAFNNLQD
ncbi:MAG: hypothetical protein DPW09_26045 [Anaerolineae bacterium]|nr:hypothetical protein [Anaerolineae bacterium]